MNVGQYEGLIGRLDAILSKMPAAPIAEPVRFTTHHLDGSKTAQVSTPPAGRPVAPHSLSEEGRQAASRALYRLLVNLDGWIQGQKENHEALEHRGRENRGEECWRLWAPADFRSMVNDVARDLGLSEFPKPTDPEEDRP